jgi:hypothetical protein
VSHRHLVIERSRVAVSTAREVSVIVGYQFSRGGTRRREWRLNRQHPGGTRSTEFAGMCARKPSPPAKLPPTRLRRDIISALPRGRTCIEPDSCDAGI